MNTWLSESKCILIHAQETPYRLLKESGGSTGSPSYLGWGKGSWEAGRTAAVQAGSWAVWGKERPAAKGTEVTQCSLQEGDQLASLLLANYLSLELRYDC